MKKIFLIFVPILLISGCTMLNIFGNSNVKEMPPDVISLGNFSVLPSGSIRAEDEFTIYFEVMNQDENDNVNVDYEIYDTGLCEFEGGHIGNDISGGESGGLEEFSPQEIRLAEWTFQTPSSRLMAGLDVTCPIRFKFRFSYRATSQVDLVVVNNSYFSELQRSGKITSYTPNINIGRGPVKVYFDFGATFPVKANALLPVYITVENKGTGLLDRIDKGALTITFPFDVSGASCPYLTCGGNTCSNSNTYIPLISKKTLEIRCGGITAPGDANPEKTYIISSTLDYNYDADGQVNVEVRP